MSNWCVGVCANCSDGKNTDTHIIFTHGIDTFYTYPSNTHEADTHEVK